MLRSSLSNLMQNTKLSTQLLIKHFVSTWFEKLPKIVSQNWPVQNGELTAYIETKQTRRQNMLKDSQRKLFCCHWTNRDGKITRQTLQTRTYSKKYNQSRAENNLTPAEI